MIEFVMWSPIRLPYIFERMIAFSIPENDVIVVVSSEGVHRIELSPVVKACTEEGIHPELIEGGKALHYGDRRYLMLGLYGGDPILDDGAGHWLDLELPERRLTITDTAGNVAQGIEFHDLSGDWGYSTFSVDRRWLVIGVPYNLYVYTRNTSAVG